MLCNPFRTKVIVAPVGLLLHLPPQNLLMPSRQVNYTSSPSSTWLIAITIILVVMEVLVIMR